jgi:hypothetical protein
MKPSPITWPASVAVIAALWPEQNNARAKKNANAADVAITSTRHVAVEKYNVTLTSSKEISDECVCIKQTRGNTIFESPGAEEKHSACDNQDTGGKGRSARAIFPHQIRKIARTRN